MKITFLGTGTSTGVPEIGCKCTVCTSGDRRDSRLRTSVLVETDRTRLLFDCGPDFRAQMLNKIKREINAIFLSHIHFDHVAGIEDLRPFCAYGRINIFAEKNVCNDLTTRLPYCFGENLYPGVPQIVLNEIATDSIIKVNELEVHPIRVMHGKMPIFGYRVGEFAYLTDVSSIPDEEYAKLTNLKVLVLGALRHEPHPTHQTIEEACRVSRRINACETYLIHFSHHLGVHAIEEKRLPNNVHLGFDDLVVEI